MTNSYIFLTFWTYVEHAFKKYINFFINGENKQQLAARLVPFDTFTNATNTGVRPIGLTPRNAHSDIIEA